MQQREEHLPRIFYVVTDFDQIAWSNNGGVEEAMVGQRSSHKANVRKTRMQSVSKDNGKMKRPRRTRTQESDSLSAIQQSVIISEGDDHYRSYHDLTIDNNGPILDGMHSWWDITLAKKQRRKILEVAKDIRTRTQDSRLGKIDNRSSVEGPKTPPLELQVVRREAGKRAFSGGFSDDNHVNLHGECTASHIVYHLLPMCKKIESNTCQKQNKKHDKNEPSCPGPHSPSWSPQGSGPLYSSLRVWQDLWEWPRPRSNRRSLCTRSHRLRSMGNLKRTLVSTCIWICMVPIFRAVPNAKARWCLRGIFLTGSHAQYHPVEQTVIQLWQGYRWHNYNPGTEKGLKEMTGIRQLITNCARWLDWKTMEHIAR